MQKILGLFVALLLLNSCEKKHTISVAFYNVENLFDTEDDPKTYDERYLPTSEIKWTLERYETKLKNLSKVIAELADGEAPDILGLCEIENRKVLEDLVSTLKKNHQLNYKILHQDSPDERGIDVALIYNPKVYKSTDYKVINIDLGGGDRTRDILHTTGKINGEKLNIFVNHWPSRRGGKQKSEPKRVLVAKVLIKHVSQLKKDGQNVMVMGDFNDEPFDKSILKVLKSEKNIAKVEANELYNPLAKMAEDGKGSYKYRDNWNMLDQIMLSPSLIDSVGKIAFLPNSQGIKSGDWLIQKSKKYYGSPMRTYGGRKYLGGYSDHFAVYLKLITE